MLEIEAYNQTKHYIIHSRKVDCRKVPDSSGPVKKRKTLIEFQ
jgi:hypothetical protein